MNPPSAEEARKLAARFAPPKHVPPPPPPDPIKRWGQVRQLLLRAPRNYRQIARALRIKPHHANTLCRRLLDEGLIEVAVPGIPRRQGAKYKVAP